MDLDLDGGTILYVLGIGFGLAALAYFARDVVFALSITVKAALLFLAFLGFLIGGIAMDRDVLDRIAMVLSAAAYVVFLVYVITRFDFAATGVFLVLAASGMLFVTLGYVLRERSPTIPARTAKIVGVVLVLSGILLVGADVATAEVQYSVELEETVTATAQTDAPPDQGAPSQEIAVGTLVATNEGPFTRSMDLPVLRGCVVGTDGVAEERIYMQTRPRSIDRRDRIGGGETLSYDIVSRIPLQPSTETVTLSVERGADCETPRDEPTLVVSVDPEDTR